MPIEKKKKIVYIMGNSRSGSTILNIVLGNTPDCMAAGEIDNILSSGLSNNEFCSCGELFKECDFWAPVGESIAADMKTPIDTFLRNTKLLENWRNLIFKKHINNNQEKLEDYNELNKAIYDHIFNHANVDAVIDASKSPMRYWHLSKIKEYDFYLIHIVRDPRGVCWSQLRSFKKDIASGVQHDMASTSYFKTIKKLYINAVQCERMKRLHPEKTITINYDEFAKSPTDSLSNIQAITGLDTQEIQNNLANDTPLTQFHNPAGNRLRMSKDIILRHDESWRSGLSKIQYFLITTFALPLIIRYKFKL